MSKLDEIRSQALQGLPCECLDSGCPAHPGVPRCGHSADVLLFRRDPQDLTGTLLCASCAVEVMEAGTYAGGGGEAEALAEREHSDRRAGETVARGRS